MSDFDDLDSLLGPLRDPATPAELASERATVDLMISSHRNPKGNPMFNSRRARVATFIAAGVIGFGGVAAAGGGIGRTGPADTPEVDPAPQTREVEEIEDEITTVDEAEDESDDDTFSDEIAKAAKAGASKTADVDENEADENEVEVTCIPGGNHGETVSEVARGVNSDYDEVEVRDAAHSDCGKSPDDDDDDDVNEVDDDVNEVDDDVNEVDDDVNEVDDDDVNEDDDDANEVDDDVNEVDDDSDEDARGSNGDQGNGNGNHGKSGNDD